MLSGFTNSAADCFSRRYKEWSSTGRKTALTKIPSGAAFSNPEMSLKSTFDSNAR
jgi:hypothetical protein